MTEDFATAAAEPWTSDHLRWQIARWTAQVMIDAGGTIGPAPTEAQVLDGLDADLLRGLRRATREPVTLAAGLVLHDVVDETRAARGHVADPATLPGMPALMVAVEVAREVRLEVARRSSLEWAHDLRTRVRAYEAVVTTGAASRLAVPPPSVAAVLALFVAGGCAQGALARVAVALRDAEALAIVDARAAWAERRDTEPARCQLAAVSQARRALALDRARSHALVRAWLPPC